MSFFLPDLASFKQRCAKLAFTSTICIISFILSFPRLCILFPSLLVFICSYPYHYGLFVPTLTPSLANTGFAANSSQVAVALARLKDENLANFALTRITFVASSNSSTVLGSDSFNDIAALQSAVATEFNSTAFTISPWVCLNSQTLSAPSTASIVRLFNSGMSYKLRDLFFGGLHHVDYFVTYAQNVSLYVFHPIATDVSLFVENFAKLLSYLALSPSQPIHTMASLLEFSELLLQRVDRSWLSTIHHIVCVFLLNATQFSMVAFVYLALANEKHLRSQFGVFAAWLYSVYFSVGCAMSLVEGPSTAIDDPQAPLIRRIIILVVMVLFCGPFFRTLKALTNKSSPQLLHKRFLRSYTGYHGLPVIFEPLLNSLMCAAASLALFSGILRIFANRDTFSYIMTGCLGFARVIFVSMVISSFLHLSFILTIVSIDLKGVDFTRALDDTIESEPDVESNGSVNFLSSNLLKLNTLSHLRPKRTSWRYRLGIFLSQIRYPMEQQRRESIVVTILLLLFLAINWYGTTPISLVHGPTGMIASHRSDLVNSTNSVLFYAEWLLSSILFIVIFLMTFRLAYTRRGLELPASRISLDRRDFENDAKYCNHIDLVAPNGPSQDILLIKTNPTSPYLVSISLDHKVLMWSPLPSAPLLKPINLSTTIQADNTIKEFWPVNHLDINNDGNFVIIMNFQSGYVKCYERARMAYTWQAKLPVDLQQSLLSKESSILESFFRRRTVPGYLRRMGLLKKGIQKDSPRERSTSNASMRSDNSMFNGEFNPRAMGLTPDDEALLRQMEKEDYVMLLNTGDLLSFSCSDGSLKILNLLREVGMSPSIGINLLCAKKVSTPRVNDRILCETLSGKLILAAISNNKWLYRQFEVKKDSYDREPSSTLPIVSAQSLSELNTRLNTSDAATLLSDSEVTSETAKTMNEPTIVAVDFVGMVVRVCGDTAELVDLLNGIVLKSFIVGRFKPHTFKVCHLEPTHCKFCGCASIQSFSIIYEDLKSKTVILHTFAIDLQRSRSSICLRVERDPREIRCAGFSAVTEHRRLYRNMEKWIVTDINIIVGFQDAGSGDAEDEEVDDLDLIPSKTLAVNPTTSGAQDFETLVSNGGLVSLRKRSTRSNNERKELQSLDKLWRGCIITAIDGKKSNFKIRESSKLMQQDFSTVSITCAQKYGYKSICIAVGSYVGIFFLGSPALIEEDMYFSGSVATLPLDLQSRLYGANPGGSPPRQNKTVNSQLLFINKRRRGLDRPRTIEL